MATDLNIVLVHGAWVDGSCWGRVIPILQQSGYRVVAVQLPLTSLADDVERTQHAMQLLTGPMILVGHSYGGLVISAAARGAQNIEGLAFISAFAPDAGESLSDIIRRFPAMDSAKDFRPDPYGFLSIQHENFPRDYAGDVDPVEARVMAAVQKPIAAAIFDEKAGQPTWRQLPTWYQISEHDRMIHPDAQRWMAERMHATTFSLPSSHAAMVSHPRETAGLILAAARHKTEIEIPAKSAPLH
jgi:pimeloyl-ACP methyl ester carboxylesterase